MEYVELRVDLFGRLVGSLELHVNLQADFCSLEVAHPVSWGFHRRGLPLDRWMVFVREHPIEMG